MDFSKLAGTKLTSEQYLTAVRQLVQLLRLGEADESEFRELAPDSPDKVAAFFHPTVAPGLFYELNFLEHVVSFIHLAGLDTHLQGIIDSGKFFETAPADLDVPAPDWLLAEGCEERSSIRHNYASHGCQT